VASGERNGAWDRELRAAAIEHVRRLERRHGVLPWSLVHEGFEFRGERVMVANRARGIFKPKQLGSGALSIKTNVPREGRVRRYDDEIASDAPYFRYAWQGTDPGAHDNVALRECLQRGLPVIYFYGVEEAVYRPIICRVVDEDRGERMFHVAPFTAAAIPMAAERDDSPAIVLERRYSVREVRQRLHQDKFRAAVLTAYGCHCAICRLKHRELLEAAHIVPDGERLGEAKVPNGLSLCKLHHAAYDAGLLGISSDCIVHLREDLLAEKDGPMLEHGLRGFHREPLVLPREKRDRPDPDLLAERWKSFAA
jgi:putative restriction endonuclease